MGLFSWLRGERGNARDVLAIEPVPSRSSTAPSTGGHGVPGPRPEAAPVDVHAEIADLIRRKRKIEAIKRLREETGCGLAVAKHAIDRGTWVEMLTKNDD